MRFGSGHFEISGGVLLLQYRHSWKVWGFFPNAMHWIAPSEKDTDNAALEKRLGDAAEQAVPAPHSAETGFNGGRPQGLLGLIFLRFAEVRFVARRAALTGQPSPVASRHPLSVGRGRGDVHEIKRYGRFDFVLANPPFAGNAVTKERIKPSPTTFG